MNALIASLALALIAAPDAAQELADVVSTASLGEDREAAPPA